MTHTSILTLAIVASLFTANLAHADAAPKDSEQNMSAEVSFLAPTVSVYYGLIGRKFWPGGTLLAGAAYIGLKEDSGNGRHEGYSFVLGASQRIWKGLQLRNLTFFSHDRFKSSVDGEVYKGQQVWTEFRAGYEFDFEIQDTSLFVNVDTILATGASTNKWPGAEEDLEWRWIVLDANVGFRF